MKWKAIPKKATQLKRTQIGHHLDKWKADLIAHANGRDSDSIHCEIINTLLNLDSFIADETTTDSEHAFLIRILLIALAREEQIQQQQKNEPISSP